MPARRLIVVTACKTKIAIELAFVTVSVAHLLEGIISLTRQDEVSAAFTSQRRISLIAVAASASYVMYLDS